MAKSLIEKPGGTCSVSDYQKVLVVLAKVLDKIGLDLHPQGRGGRRLRMAADRILKGRD